MKKFITKIDRCPYENAETPYETWYVVSPAEDVQDIRKANPGKYGNVAGIEVVNSHMDWEESGCGCKTTRCETVEVEIEERGIYGQEMLAEAFKKASA